MERTYPKKTVAVLCFYFSFKVFKVIFVKKISLFLIIKFLQIVLNKKRKESTVFFLRRAREDSYFFNFRIVSS